MRVTSLTRSQTRPAGADIRTVTESCMRSPPGRAGRALGSRGSLGPLGSLGSIEVQGPEHHAGARLRAEVGRLGRHAPTLVGPDVDLLHGDGTQEKGSLRLAA